MSSTSSLAPLPPFQVEVAVFGLHPRIQLAGALDQRAADALEVLLRPLRDLPDAVRVDAAAVRSLSPGALAPLMAEALDRHREGRPPVVISRASVPVCGYLETFGVTAELPVDLSDALGCIWPT